MVALNGVPASTVAGATMLKSRSMAKVEERDDSTAKMDGSFIAGRAEIWSRKGREGDAMSLLEVGEALSRHRAKDPILS